MKRVTSILITTFCLLLVGQLAQAGARNWELDKAHSNFYFSVGHIFSAVQGHFNDYSAEIKFDPTNLADSRFFFEVKVASIDTNIAKRDKHLQSADFFDEGKFPTMTFESSEITGGGGGMYNVKGKFTVKGESYDLVLPLNFAGIKGHPAVKGKDVIGFNSNLTIDRLAYKIGKGKFYDMGVVGKDVKIFLTLEALGDK